MLSIQKIKYCKYCETEKTIADFNKNGRYQKDGTPILKPYCKECRIIINKKMYDKRKENGYYKKKENND